MALYTICMLASLVATLVNLGVTVYQGEINVHNSDVKRLIFNISSSIQKGISSKKISLSKLISKIQSGNANAVTQMLYSNPMISKTLQQIAQDDTLLNQIAAEATELENRINEYKAELNSLGYATTIGGSDDEKAKAIGIHTQLEQANKAYDDLLAKASTISPTSSQIGTSPTAHLDAVSQNLAGGIK